MGPITLFDKSFIQSLSLDESVWFDHFFLTNVCPLFYVETLADLDKSGLKGRSPEEEVRIIADKFPEMNSGPCAHHVDLCIANLQGFDVPMTGQIPLAHARLVMHEGRPSAFSEESPVAQAFSRWQAGNYLEVEHLFARAWRDALVDLDLDNRRDLFEAIGIDTETCRTLEDARNLAASVISSDEAPLNYLNYGFTGLGVPATEQAKILSRWESLGNPKIQDFARYAAFMLSVELFFDIALETGLISPNPPANRIDIAYLFYLPFCMAFTSSDRLHRRTAPLFLRHNQEFIWGPDLKVSLSEINLFFSLYPDSEKEKGLNRLAPFPPTSVDTLVSELWDRHLPSWRDGPKPDPTVPKQVPTDIISKVDQIQQAQPIKPDPDTFRTEDIESITIKRVVRRRKGTWYQIPKDIT